MIFRSTNEEIGNVSGTRVSKGYVIGQLTIVRNWGSSRPSEKICGSQLRIIPLRQWFSNSKPPWQDLLDGLSIPEAGLHSQNFPLRRSKMGPKGFHS